MNETNEALSRERVSPTPSAGGDRPDLNLLVVFDAVARLRSVTEAAEALSLSQPAVSHALNRLRDVVGDPLFVRGRGGLIATPRALEMAGPARETVEAARGLLVPARFDPARATRGFRVAASDYALATLAAALLRALRAEAPGCRIDLTAGGGAREALERGAVDLAFGAWPAFSPPLRSTPLFEERFVGLVDVAHPLARSAQADAVDLNAYLSYPHVVTAAPEIGRSAIDRALDALGRSRRIAVTSPSHAGALACLSGTDLVMTAPSRLAATAQGRVVAFTPPLTLAPFAYRMAWHDGTQSDPACAWLRALALRTLASDSG